MIKNNSLNEMFVNALSYHKNNKIREAANEYIKIIKLDPKNFIAYNNLGAINESLNKINVAKELFLNAIKLNPNYIDAIFNLGNISNKLKDYNLAKEYFEKIIKIDPKNEIGLQCIRYYFL
jgi:tetratricopeptide (TPR) repeat protein